MFNSDKPFGELLTEEFVTLLIAQCERDRAAGKYPREVSEGARLSAEFRRMFPDVEDKDLGTMLIVITRLLSVIGNSNAGKLGTNIDICIGSYNHAAANILKSVHDMREL